MSQAPLKLGPSVLFVAFRGESSPPPKIIYFPSEIFTCQLGASQWGATHVPVVLFSIKANVAISGIS